MTYKSLRSLFSVFRIKYDDSEYEEYTYFCMVMNPNCRKIHDSCIVLTRIKNVNKILSKQTFVVFEILKSSSVGTLLQRSIMTEVVLIDDFCFVTVDDF